MFSKKGEMGEVILTVVIFSLLTSLGIAGTTKLVAKRLVYESDCSGVEIQLEKMKGNESLYDICSNPTFTVSNLKFKIKNAGNKPIKGFIINMVGRRGTDSNLISEGLDIGASSDFKVNYEKLRYAELQEVYIVPMHSRLNATCYESIFSTKSIGVC